MLSILNHLDTFLQIYFQGTFHYSFDHSFDGHDSHLVFVGKSLGWFSLQVEVQCVLVWSSAYLLKEYPVDPDTGDLQSTLKSLDFRATEYLAMLSLLLCCNAFYVKGLCCMV